MTWNMRVRGGIRLRRRSKRRPRRPEENARRHVQTHLYMNMRDINTRPSSSRNPSLLAPQVLQPIRTRMGRLVERDARRVGCNRSESTRWFSRAPPRDGPRGPCEGTGGASSLLHMSWRSPRLQRAIPWPRGRCPLEACAGGNRRGSGAQLLSPHFQRLRSVQNGARVSGGAPTGHVSTCWSQQASQSGSSFSLKDSHLNHFIVKMTEFIQKVGEPSFRPRQGRGLFERITCLSGMAAACAHGDSTCGRIMTEWWHVIASSAHGQYKEQVLHGRHVLKLSSTVGICASTQNAPLQTWRNTSPVVPPIKCTATSNAP